MLSRGNERKDIFHDDRNLPVYLTCTLTNDETGRLFGMTYSAVSHILSSMRTRIQKDSDLRVKYYYLFAMQDVAPSSSFSRDNEDIKPAKGRTGKRINRKYTFFCFFLIFK